MQFHYIQEMFQKVFLQIILKGNGLNGYLHDFSIDNDAFAIDDILDVQKCLMKENGIV